MKRFPSEVVLQVFKGRRNRVPQTNLDPCTAGVHWQTQREPSGASANCPSCAVPTPGQSTPRRNPFPAPISTYNTPGELQAAKQELGFVCFYRSPLPQLLSKHIADQSSPLHSLLTLIKDYNEFTEYLAMEGSQKDQGVCPKPWNILSKLQSSACRRTPKLPARCSTSVMWIHCFMVQA